MKIFIVGAAGGVGSSVANALVMAGTADELVLFDLNEDMTESHSLDLAQAAFLMSGTKVRKGGWPEAQDADIVIVAAGLPQVKTTLDPFVDLPAMKPLITSIAENVARYCPKAVVLSLTNPLDSFNYVLAKTSGLPVSQFISMSVNDCLRFRYAIAGYKGLDAAAVDAMVVGEHNKDKLPLFSTVTVDGRKAAFTEAEQKEIIDSMNAFWGHFIDVTGPRRTATWTTAASTLITVEHITGKKSGPICCSCILDEDGPSIGYPAYLSKEGVVKAAELSMTEEELAKFTQAKEKAREQQKAVLAVF